jgi:hypothetical protein
VFVALAVWVVPDHQAVATTLGAFGAGAIIFGAVLPRLAGEFRIGPSGVTAVLSAVDRKAREMELPQDRREEATRLALNLVLADPSLGPARRSTRALSHTTDAVITAPVAEAIADAAIAYVEAEDADGNLGGG